MYKRLPSYSIVIETENLGGTNWRYLTRCLDALSKQEGLEQAKEIVLVHEPAAPVGLQRLKDAYPWLTLVELPAGTMYYGSKNYGAWKTTGDYILFLDSDCEPQPGWIVALLAIWTGEREFLGKEADPYVSVVGGETTVLPKGIHGLAMACAYIFPQFSYSTRVDEVDQFWANNCAIKRKTLERWPFMDNERITRCPEHAYRLVDHWAGIVRQPEARVVHVPTPWERFAYRWFTHGRDGARWSKVLHRNAPMWKLAPYSCLWKSREVMRQTKALLRKNPRLAWRLPLATPIIAAAMVLYGLGAASAMLPEGRRVWSRSSQPSG